MDATHADPGGDLMDKRNLIHPMTAGDLVHSACVLAIRERGMGAETETSIWECIDIGPNLADETGWPSPSARADITFRDRQTGEQATLTLRADTPLLFTRITR